MSEGHARLSPSGAPGWTRCPGKPNAEDGYADTSSPAAIEGTCAHHIAEQVLSGQRTLESYRNVRVGLGEGRGHWLVDTEMLHYVQEYMDNVRGIARELPVHLVETRVGIGHITGEEGAAGTADFIAAGEGVIQVHDLKYGKGVRVEAEDNEQLAIYALGAIKELELYFDIDEDWQVEMYIHQPRLDHLPEWRMPLWALRELGEQLSIAAELTKPANAPRIPGEKQCRFCKHAPECDAFAEFVNKAVTDELPMLTEEPDTPAMSSLVEHLPRLKMIRDWCAAVEARAIHLLESGVPVGDWKLVAGRGSRQWTLPEDEVAKKLANRGLKTADVYDKKVISVAKAEKLLDKKRWEKLARELVVKKEGKPTIAPGTDKRPALNTADAVGFEDVTEKEWME